MLNQYIPKVFENLTLTLFLLLSLPLMALPQDSLSDLDLLIESTKELLQNQEELRLKLNTYIELKSAYLKDMENRELLKKTARLAKSSLDIIKENKLTPLFEPDFISEMTLFAKLATTPSIPGP